MSRRTRALAAATLALTTGLALLTGCSSGSGRPELTVRGAYVPQPLTAEMASGYLTVTNHGDTADTLTSVTSDLADDVTMHRTVGDAMRQVRSLEIPAHGTLELARGGSHLMFMKLRHKPVRGETVSLRLHFATSGPITLDAPVEATGYLPKK